MAKLAGSDGRAMEKIQIRVISGAEERKDCNVRDQESAPGRLLDPLGLLPSASEDNTEHHQDGYYKGEYSISPTDTVRRARPKREQQQPGHE